MWSVETKADWSTDSKRSKANNAVMPHVEIVSTIDGARSNAQQGNISDHGGRRAVLRRLRLKHDDSLSTFVADVACCLLVDVEMQLVPGLPEGL